MDGNFVCFQKVVLFFGAKWFESIKLEILNEIIKIFKSEILKRRFLKKKMSEVSSAGEYFREFAEFDHQFNPNRGLDWCSNATAVTEFADRLPMGARPMARRLVELAVADEWYGNFPSWIIYGRQGRLIHCVRWRDGGLAGEACYELALARNPADRHYPLCASWASIENGVWAPEGDSVYMAATVENEYGLVTLDGFRMPNQLPAMLPSGEEFVALDLTSDHAVFQPILVMDI